MDRPFELQCPSCGEWTNIFCTDEELLTKSLNKVCPHCLQALNYNLPGAMRKDGVYIVELAHPIVYRERIIL